MDLIVCMLQLLHMLTLRVSPAGGGGLAVRQHPGRRGHRQPLVQAAARAC